MLDVMIKAFQKQVLLRGEVTRSDILDMAKRDIPSEFLPYLAFLKKLPDEDFETNAFINFDNTIGWIFELSPLAFVGGKQLDQLHTIVKTQFPKGTVAQFILVTDQNHDAYLKAYEATRNMDDPLTAMSVSMMKKFIKDGAKGVNKLANIPTRNFRLFYTVKNETRIPEDLLIAIETGFGMLHMSPKRWDASDLIRWASEFFSGKPFKGHYDPSRSLSKQMGMTKIKFNIDNQGIAQIGDRYGICLSPNVIPQEKNTPLRTNLLFGDYLGDDMSQIKSPFMYTFTMIYETKELKKLIGDKASQTVIQRVGAGLAASLNQRIKELMIMQDKLAKGERYIYYIPQLWVFGDTEKEVRKSAGNVKTLWENNDFEMMYEHKIQNVMFYTSLPFGFLHLEGNLEKIDRHYIADTENITRFLPVQGDFRGAGKPIQSYIGRKGQLIPINMFDKRANAHNFYVIAETGAGKSFYLNDMLDSYSSAGAKVRIVDLGASYKKLTQLKDGRYIDFSLANPICINPLDFIYGDTEDFEQNISAAQLVFGSAAYSFTGKTVNEIEANIIDQACHAALLSGDQLRGTDFLIDYFNRSANLQSEFLEQRKIATPLIEETAKNLAFLLGNFSSSGPFGKFFTGATTFNIADDEFVCTDIEKLRSVKQLFFPMVMSLMNSITQDLYLSDRSRPTFILFEEVASIVKKVGNVSMAGIGEMADEAYRRARKYMGSFGMVLQSPLDLEGLSGLGDVARANAQFRYYLMSKLYGEAAKKDLLTGIKGGFPLDLLDSVINKKPHYSEVFIDSVLGSGIARLCVDQWKYWVYTSDGDEVAKFNDLCQEGVDPISALIKLSGVDPRKYGAA